MRTFVLFGGGAFFSWRASKGHQGFGRAVIPGAEIARWGDLGRPQRASRRVRNMSRVGLVLRAGGWATVLAAAASLTLGATQTSAFSREWCEAHQLTLSNARGPHTDFGQAESTFWFLQIRNHGNSACLTGGWLTLVSARSVNGTLIKVRGVPGFGLPGSAKTFVLHPHGRAFVELGAGFPTTVPASRRCKLHVLLTFSLPHDGGKLAVRVPREAGVLCPRKPLGISETDDAAAFLHFMRELNTKPSGVPYARAPLSTRVTSPTAVVIPEVAERPVGSVVCARVSRDDLRTGGRRRGRRCGLVRSRSKSRVGFPSHCRDKQPRSRRPHRAWCGPQLPALRRSLRAPPGARPGCRRSVKA